MTVKRWLLLGAGLVLLLLGVGLVEALGWDKADKAASVGSFILAVLMFVIAADESVNNIRVSRMKRTPPAADEARPDQPSVKPAQRRRPRPAWAWLLLAAGLMAVVVGMRAWAIWPENKPADEAAPESSPAVAPTGSPIAPSQGYFSMTLQPGQLYDLARPADRTTTPEVADLEFRADGRALRIPDENKTTVIRHLGGPKDIATAASHICPTMGYRREAVMIADLSVGHVICIKMGNGLKAVIRVESVARGAAAVTNLKVKIAVFDAWPSS